MLHKLGKEIDDVDAKIGARWQIWTEIFEGTHGSQCCIRTNDPSKAV